MPSTWWEGLIAKTGLNDHELLVRLLAAHAELATDVKALVAEVSATTDVVFGCRELVDLLAAQAAMATSFVDRFDRLWTASPFSVSGPSGDAPGAPQPGS